MPGWAACLLIGRASDIAALRLFPNIELAEIGGAFWLRGNKLDDALEHELKKIPGLERFELLASDRLRPAGCRIPDRTLPPGAWRPLRQVVIGSLPVAAPGGENTQKVPIALMRSGQEEPALALLSALDQWVEYATNAPVARLTRLRFAAAEHGEVLILGSPLPAIPGRRYAGKKGILVPCGFTWTPAVDASVLCQVFGLKSDDLVVLAEDHTHQVIRGEQFVPASRSAARITATERNHG
jgi:hypothetical protein